MKKVYIETYGCQMNAADSELIGGILKGDAYSLTGEMDEADILLVNTCAIRENAEKRIYGRLGQFKRIKERRPQAVVGILGCMAERLRDALREERAKGVGQIVDLIVGPDEYRRLPELIERAWHGERGIAVKLSRVETYDDVTPIRTGGTSAWISVMRGCDKFCTFCVVPFTRGRERSRSFDGVVAEVAMLAGRGFREVTLLGQNVNSYNDRGRDFADLLGAVAAVDRALRVRFTTSHPVDMSDKLIATIAATPNLCKYIHLPVQSGSDRILALMERGYDRAHYLGLVRKLRAAMPDVSLSTDIITGFPTETEEDHRETVELMRTVGYDGAFMFKYSPRENTPAFTMGDDVTDEVKTRRLDEIIRMQNGVSLERNRRLIGETVEVLVEGESRKSAEEMHGRTDGNRVVVFKADRAMIGRAASVRIVDVNSATLFGVTA